MARHHPPTGKAPSSLEEGVGGGGVSPETLRLRARVMRNNPTEPEKRLWMALRDRRFCGFKFRRQDVIGRRIVDFFCPAKGLLIEVDGHTHDAATDVARDERMLRDFGFVTVRFSNEDVMRNLDGCLTRLQSVLEGRSERWSGRASLASRHHPPTPSSEEEGEE